MATKDAKSLAAEAGNGDIHAARRLVSLMERGGDEHLGKKVMDRIVLEPEWPKALEVARGNARGELWLVGGKVYRTLAEALHGKVAGASKCDFDFLATDKTAMPMVPKRGDDDRPMMLGRQDSWEVSDRPARLGTMDIGTRKFRLNGRDLVDLLTLDLPRRRGTTADIDGYFRTVPFDVQAIAIDVATGRIFGPGIEAVRSRRVSVNNEQEFTAYSERAGSLPKDLLEERSWSLGFSEKPSRTKPRSGGYYASSWYGS